MPGTYLSFLAAFAIAVVFADILRRVAIHASFVDLPDSRKLHDGQIPLCGGIAIFSAFGIADIVFSSPSFAIQGNLALALAILVVSGAADDRWKLSARLRLIIQFAAALFLVLPGAPYSFNLMGSAYGVVPQSFFPIVAIFALVFVVGVINATNMSDGIDGLAGGWTAAALFWLALIAHSAGKQDTTFVALLLIAAIIGFLAFNMRHPWRSKASIFMGDAGSVGIGGAIGYFVISLSSGPHGVSFASLLWIVIIPMTDMASLVVRRALAGRSPMSADRWHLHHLVLDLGIPHGMTSGLILFASALCGAVAWFGTVFGVPDIILAAGLVLPASIHSAFVFFACNRIAMRSGVHRPSEPALGLTTGRFEASGQ